VVGDLEQLLASHKVLTGPRSDMSGVGGVASVVQETSTERQTIALVRTDGRILDPGFTQEDVGLEDLVLA
jgi:ABC-2 type transport system ATP-binding protein